MLACCVLLCPRERQQTTCHVYAVLTLHVYVYGLLCTVLCVFVVLQKDNTSASEKDFAKRWDSTVSSTGFVTFSTLASKAVSSGAAVVLLLSQCCHCCCCVSTVAASATAAELLQSLLQSLLLRRNILSAEGALYVCVLLTHNVIHRCTALM
jgi:hypothetical protein